MEKLNSINCRQQHRYVEQAHTYKPIMHIPMVKWRILPAEHWRSYYPSRNVSPSGDWSNHSSDQRQPFLTNMAYPPEEEMNRNNHHDEVRKLDLNTKMGVIAKEPKRKTPTEDNNGRLRE
jgi:hypothetical protein